MSCLSWNARGVGNPRTFRDLSRAICLYKPLIIFISESHCSNLIVSRINYAFPLYSCFCVPSIGKSGGLLLLWIKDLPLHVMSFSLGHIDSFIKETNFWWRFTSFYGNPKVGDRVHSWDLLARLSINNSLP